jgi:hypothetical protein
VGESAVSRKKPRLYSFPRDVELGYFPDVPPGSTAWRALAAAVDAFAAICEAKTATPTQVDALTDAARHPHPSVSSLGAGRLAVLAHYHPPAGDALTGLLVDPSEQTRLFAAAALANAPAPLASVGLATAARDPSWTLRKAAAQVCTAIPLPGFGPQLAAWREGERDARVRVVLQQAEDFQARAGEAAGIH